MAFLAGLTLRLTARAVPPPPAPARLWRWPFWLCTVPLPADLFRAVFDLVAADASLTAAFGRSGWLWHTLGPHAQPLPYAVWADIDRADELLLWAERAGAAAGHVQVTVYASSRTQARTLSRRIAETIEAASRAHALVCTDLGPVQLARSESALDVATKDPEPGPAGETVWGHVLQYSFLGSA